MAVYFIQAGENGPIKVGTARDPWKRLTDLQVASAHPLKMIGCWPEAGREQEAAIHRAHKADRLRGEWFAPTSSLIGFAKQFPPAKARSVKKQAKSKHPLGRWIEESGLTRKSFAEQVGCSPAYVTALCNGTIWPGRSMVERIVHVTDGDVTANDFLGRENAA